MMGLAHPEEYAGGMATRGAPGNYENTSLNKLWDTFTLWIKISVRPELDGKSLKQQTFKYFERLCF